jgi:hypothetical protein
MRLHRVATSVTVLLLSPLVLLASAPARAEPPRTVAETSDYKSTTRHADVLAFCKKLADQSRLVHVAELGKSHDGKPIPLLVVADPPIKSAEEAARSKKLVVFAMANIHAGEVDGKEALLMLARDIALAKKRPLLKDLILVLVPNFNPDGNEKMSRENRQAQNGPPLVGTRANAQGFDLNRDFVKLESPEVRALVKAFNDWAPAVVIDCHTTNGSFHRYTLTYEGGRSPVGDGKLVAHVRDMLLPEVSRRMARASGYRSYFYGNFSPGRDEWRTVLPIPRFGTHYVGLRNRIAILSESYSYASFKDRVLATRAFVQSICEYTAEHKDTVRKLLEEARSAASRTGGDPKEKQSIALRYTHAPVGRPHSLLGYVEELKDGKRASTGKPKEYEVLYWGGTKTTLTVSKPYAYLFPATLRAVVENLQRHGIVVEELREGAKLDVEAYKVGKVERRELFQKHKPVLLEVTARKEARRFPAGTILVRTGQPLGNLAAFLLEPESMDGLVTWNFFDKVVAKGKDFPVLRLPKRVPLTLVPVRPLPEERKRELPPRK